MNTNFIKRYEHTWRIFERMVDDFDDKAWLHTGRKTITPARLSFHILKAVKYYIEDPTTIFFASGKTFDINSETTGDEELPSQEDIITCIHEFQKKASRWLSKIDLHAKNETFSWAGETKFDVVLFLLSHTLFHIGELSSLLNESQNGDVEDHYVKTL